MIEKSIHYNNIDLLKDDIVFSIKIIISSSFLILYDLLSISHNVQHRN